MARNHKSKATERRDFLKTVATLSVATSFDPVQALVKGLSNSVFRSAMAATTGAEPRSYVFLGFDHAPNRRVWDQMLTPYEAAKNGAVPRQSSNVYRNNDPKYETASISVGGKAVNAPVLWTADSPRGKLSQLLENTMVVQGIRLLGDSHANGFRSNMLPTAGGYSVNGMVAANSSKPLAAVNLGYMDVFRAPNGMGIKNLKMAGDTDYNDRWVGGRNLVSELLDPLNSRSNSGSAPGSRDGLNANFLTRKQAMASVVDAALLQLKKTAEIYQVGSGIMTDLSRSAATELNGNLFNIFEDYNQTLTKYLNLQAQATAAAKAGAIPGITSESIYPKSAAERASMPNAGDGGYDLRNLIQSNSYLVGIAEGLAVAEVLIRNGKAASISSSTNGKILNNTGLYTSETNTTGGPRNFHVGADGHGDGLGLELVATSYAFYVTSVLLLEFRAAMKAKNLWDQVVVHVGGDFGRTPRAALDGSDHGWQGSCMSLFSGCINGFKSFGNILSRHEIFDPADGVHGGLWGSAGRVDGIDSNVGHALNIGNFASTLCTLLKVPSPADNFHSVVSLSDSTGIKALVGETKIVDVA